MNKKIQTAERVSHQERSDNYVFQRSILAYYETAKLISGKSSDILTEDSCSYSDGFIVKR